MNQRLLLIPRWGGTPTSDWYPWARAELNAHPEKPFGRLEVASMPQPDSPTIPAWVGRVRELLGEDLEELGRTVVLGHSVGCQALLRALAELPGGARVAGTMCVAGWFWTDDPWESLLPWIETPLDLERARTASGSPVVAMISDDDPFTGDWRANAAAWRERMGADVVLAPGAKHFNATHHPIIVETMLERFHGTGERE